VSYLSLTWFSMKKIHRFSRVPDRELANVIPRYYCMQFHAVWKKGGDTEKESEIARNKGKRQGQVVFSVSLHRGAVVHIRANRKIDKKRRFVKCRGRFSSSGDGRSRPRVEMTVIPLGSYYCSRIYWDWFTQPFRCESVSGTLMLCGTRAGFFVFVSRTMGFVSREISWAPQSVYSAHHSCRQMK